MKTLKRVLFGTTFAALLAAPAAHAVPNLGAFVSQAPFAASGSSVTVHFLFNDAGNNNRLFALVNGTLAPAFMINVPSGQNTGTPLTASFATTIGDDVRFLLCTSSGPSNTIPVCNANGFPTGWYSGPAAGNSDGLPHVAITTAAFWNANRAGFGQAAPAGTVVFGFEDLSLGDADYNDTIFSASNLNVVPEPATMVLLATGLVALAGAGAVRRRRDRR